VPGSGALAGTGFVQRILNDRKPKPRIAEPVRSQGFFRFTGDELPLDHPARVLDMLLGQLNLDGFTANAKAVEGRAGRPTNSPRMMLALWMYAISIGVGSAREIARLLRTDAAFRWIAGERAVSHQALSAFRVGCGEQFDKLFTQVLGVLLQKGLLDLSVVAQDGTRIRASASAPSFRKEASLEACREQAALHLKAVLASADGSRPSRVAEAKARDFQRRVDEALAVVGELQPKKKDAVKRASTTDPDARVMKMPDGGFRPGFNVQLGVAGKADGGPRTIVGVQVTNVGSDLRSVPPMAEQIEERTGVRPGAMLADANHATIGCIKYLAEKGIRPVISVPGQMLRPGHNGDRSPEVEAWKASMQEPDAQRLYRSRASLVELVNGALKDRFDMGQVLVRGTGKVRSVALLGALTYNLLAHAPGLLA